MTLNILGDSHSIFSFAGIADANIYWRGPVTMHRAARDGIASLVPKNCRLKSGDFLVLSFGEIDCRAHIPKQAQRNGRTTLQEVELLCDRFEAALAKFRQSCKAQIGVMCVLPFSATLLPTEYYASVEECIADANVIRARMNTRLASMGVPFIDCREYFTLPDGSMKPSASDGNVHIDSRHTKPVVAALQDAFGIAFAECVPPWPDPRPRAEPPYVSPWKRFRRRAKALVTAWMPPGRRPQSAQP